MARRNERRGAVGPVLAAASALVLGACAAVAVVAGRHRWDGPTLVSWGGSHGLHRGDVLAVLPILLAIGLARWCLVAGAATERSVSAPPAAIRAAPPAATRPAPPAVPAAATPAAPVGRHR